MLTFRNVMPACSCWTGSGRFWRSVCAGGCTSVSGTSSKRNSLAFTAAVNSMSGSPGLCGRFSKTSGPHYVSDGDQPPGPGAFDLREVHPQLLRLSSSSVRCPGLPGPIAAGSLSGRFRRLVDRTVGLARNLPDRSLHCIGCLILHFFCQARHVLHGDEPVGARALDLREVHPALPRLAPRGVRGFDLALLHEALGIEVGDVLLRLVQGLLDGRVVVHQLLKEHLEGLFLPTGDLVRQLFQGGPVLPYLLLELLDRITEEVLGQLHRLPLNHLLGLLYPPVQLLESVVHLILGHLSSSPTPSHPDPSETPSAYLKHPSPRPRFPDRRAPARRRSRNRPSRGSRRGPDRLCTPPRPAGRRRCRPGPRRSPPRSRSRRSPGCTRTRRPCARRSDPPCPAPAAQHPGQLPGLALRPGRRHR